ncbi:hypothetical protein K488DRAFT_90106 [Vararia minispora EC-137]|uniref:Uncharacterized protein n=1 Tax=Vararia minispora EC-137 TaxID=1314806 RepID=A0ACB8Q8X7_9AGAM|nr:hypothetical protein K488DRAFT_90106 [Vararia minispora EC-137]
MSTEGENELSETRKPVPRWIPVMLLTVTTAALAVPLLALRRERSVAQGFGKHVRAAAPPVRRPGQRFTTPAPAARTARRDPAPANAPLSDVPPPRRRSTAFTPVPNASSSKHPPAPAAPRGVHLPDVATDGFNATLHGFKAFGAATTVIVGLVVAGVWGVKLYTGASDTRELAGHMRAVLEYALPALSGRLQSRAPSSPLPLPIALPPPSAEERAADVPPVVEEEESRMWTRDGARDRLATAYAQGGFVRWAETARREMELEALQLRAREEGKPSS